MCKSKILLGITGSIAAYKSAYLISKLIQNDFEVKVVATDCALKFIGTATLEGLTGNKVYTDSFEEGEMMSHIALVKWSDITVVCPASGNTINKMAAGIADNLLTSLFLAHDRTKPYLIVPAMNTNMFEHPATQESIKKLQSWGVVILPTAEGYLACGDIGRGKLLEPDEIYERILIAIKQKQQPQKRMNILITAGGTKESIDGIRYLTNLSTGRTAAEIANYFGRRGHCITYIHANNSKLPSVDCKLIGYNDFKELNEKIKTTLESENFDAVIHNAAVSDYSPESLLINGESFSVPYSKKIDSNNPDLLIRMKSNPKIIDHLKKFSRNKDVVVVGFKFTNSCDEKEKEEVIQKLFGHSHCDFIVSNDKNDRDQDNRQKEFTLYKKTSKLRSCHTPLELSINLEEILLNEQI